MKLYDHYKCKVKIEIEKAKKLWARNASCSAKQLWNVVRDFDTDKRKEPISLLDGDHCAEKLDVVADVFQASFSQSDVPLLQQQMPKSLSVEEISPCVNIGCVYRLLKRLDITKSAGSDQLHPKLLRFGASALAEPLAHIYEESLRSGTVPKKWKLADIVPAPKCKRPTFQDLRPISLLPIPSKILERIVLDKEKQNLLRTYDTYQFAYRPGGSTTAALVTIHDKVTCILDQSDCVGVSMAAIDLSKAFDKVPHKHLVSYLRSMTSTVFLKWLTNYLSDRCFRVSYSGCYSTLRTILSGVPQGSIIGLYLFASYMSGLQPTTDKVWYMKYADDITVIQPLSRSGYDPFTENELPHIRAWISAKGLILNEKKTKRIVFSKSCLLSFPNISCDHSLKILGVTFSCDLRWKIHIDAIVRLSSSRLHLLRLLKPILCTKDLVVVYNSIIVSVLTYASPVFIGLNVNLSEALERVQRRAHRVICGSHCGCDAFSAISVIRLQQAMKLMRSAEMFPYHPLHNLVPQRLPHTNVFQQPPANTDRRLRSFVPFTTRVMCMKTSSFDL